MRDGPPESPWSSAAGPDLLNLASSVLAREASRMASQLAMPVLPSAASGIAPVGPGDAPREGGPGAWPAAAGLGTEIHRLGALVEPVIGATVPVPPPDMDLLATTISRVHRVAARHVQPGHGREGGALRGSGPAHPVHGPRPGGGEAVATMVVANDEDTPSEVSLFLHQNFAADSGHGNLIGSRHGLAPNPRSPEPGGRPPRKSDAAVPQQAAARTCSGLIQATRTRYVKAVLSVEVGVEATTRPALPPARRADIEGNDAPGCLSTLVWTDEQ